MPTLDASRVSFFHTGNADDIFAKFFGFSSPFGEMGGSGGMRMATTERKVVAMINCSRRQRRRFVFCFLHWESN